MKLSTISQRLAVVLLLSLGIAVFYATYRAIDSIVADQSRIQQKALSPVYKLVRDELLRPLYIAETFASSVDFTAAMDGSDLDEAALLERLQNMEQSLDLIFFVASEKTRKQYLSDGRTLDLVEGEVSWYFEAKARDADFMADLGQVGDVHLYFDVKVYSPEQEFLGYVGVGKGIQKFLDTFDRYKARYGYDFVFVNEANEIILTSLPDLVVTDAYIPSLDQLEGFESNGGRSGSFDGEITQVDENDFLISEFRIEELGWRLMLLTPLEARQAQITRAFIKNALAALVIVLLLAAAFLILMLLYKRSLEQRAELDDLTGLPNRTHVQRRFRQLEKAGVELCVIIIDLDRFKLINDSYGHDAGDRVLRAAANTFKQELREEDIVSRWGGEEFVMLIPASSIELGRAIAERARTNLEALEIEIQSSKVSVTASFGVAFGSAGKESLAELLARADKMLYEAKAEGRNQVRLYLVSK
ncbi:MAG: sensor domain-containing diguanylate cyclase [Pseudomonadota bacterium]